MRRLDEAQRLGVKVVAPAPREIDRIGQERIAQHVLALEAGGRGASFGERLLDRGAGAQVVAVLRDLALGTLPMGDQRLMGQADARAVAIAIRHQEANLRVEKASTTRRSGVRSANRAIGMARAVGSAPERLTVTSVRRTFGSAACASAGSAVKAASARVAIAPLRPPSACIEP